MLSHKLDTWVQIPVHAGECIFNDTRKEYIGKKKKNPFTLQSIETFQPIAGLTSASPQIEKKALAILGVTRGQHVELPSRFWLSTSILSLQINRYPNSSRSWVGTDLPCPQSKLGLLHARQWLCLCTTTAGTYQGMEFKITLHVQSNEGISLDIILKDRLRGGRLWIYPSINIV